MSTEPQPPTGPPAGVPTCYRHPGRETYVRCTRCDRPICPDCMREASVGHQCVECVQDGNRTVRRPQAVFGGAHAQRPVVTISLIVVNVAAWLLQLANASISTDYGMLGAVTDRAGNTIPGYGVAGGEWYRLITGAFLHLTPRDGGLWMIHLLFNMYLLWVLGGQLEMVLGRARFLTLYLLAAVGGNVLEYLLAPNTLAVGASGAVFGLFGAAFIVGRRMGADTRGIVFLLVINLILSFSGSVSWQGHVGGLITGTVLAIAYVHAPKNLRNAVAVGASVAVAAALVILTAVQTAGLTA